MCGAQDAPGFVQWTGRVPRPTTELKRSRGSSSRLNKENETKNDEIESVRGLGLFKTTNCIEDPEIARSPRPLDYLSRGNLAYTAVSSASNICIYIAILVVPG